MPLPLAMNPPPSTFAAQVVNNVEATRSQPAYGKTQPGIRELLSMALQADQQIIPLDYVLDQDPEVNQKLINVVVQACLFPSSLLDPFQNLSEAQKLQADGLAVIEFTVRRRPEVLLSSPRIREKPLDPPKAPLFLWLIPHLVNYFLGTSNEALLSSTRNALKTLLSVNGGSSRFKINLNPVFRYADGCINGEKARSLV